MNIAVGYLIGMHLLSKGLNDHHPLLEINESVLIYENSFEKPSVAVYKTFGNGEFKLRVGATTGYFKYQNYKEKTYEVPTATENGVGLFVVPTYERNGFVAAVLGDSINVGFIWKFR